MDVPHPNPDGGSGRVLKELAPGVDAPEVPQYIKRFNAGIRMYEKLTARMTLESQEHPRYDVALMQLQNTYNGKHAFYGVEHILDWKKAGSLENLVKTNDETLACMRGLIAAESASVKSNERSPEGCW
jgi:hypothetical protein